MTSVAETRCFSFIPAGSKAAGLILFDTWDQILCKNITEIMFLWKGLCTAGYKKAVPGDIVVIPEVFTVIGTGEGCEMDI